MTTAFQMLKRLAERHAQHGRCILCGRGPGKATTRWGACKHCGFGPEAEELREVIENEPLELLTFAVSALEERVRKLERK